MQRFVGCGKMSLRIFGIPRILRLLEASCLTDVPSALALAKEVESNHDRYTFTACFAGNQDEKDRKSAKNQGKQNNKTHEHHPSGHKESIHGATAVKNNCFISVSNLKAHSTEFKGLFKEGATLCLLSRQLRCEKNTEKISFHTCVNVNLTKVDCTDHPLSVTEEFKKVIQARKKS